MIPRITRGHDGNALLAYLVDCESPRNVNVHEHPHVVAGSIGREMIRDLSREDASYLGSSLNAFNLLWEPNCKQGHIWQCSLALKVDEPPLGDDLWGDVATDFMRRMGFHADGGPEVRWVAIDHGKSLKGNPHIHIAASVVRSDGGQVDTYYDYRRAQHACTELELKYGLNVLESRLAGVGSKGYSQLDARIARDAGLDVPRPVELEVRVRAHAVASQSEAEFVRRLRADGLLLRPQFKEGEVKGYAVGVPALHGEKQMMYAGSKLAADLSLPKLRKSWPDLGGSRAEAYAEWSLGLPGKPVETHGREAAPVAVDESTIKAVVDDLHAEARAIPAMTREEFSLSSARLSGALGAASLALESPPGKLAAASRDVGAWAQPKTRTAPQKRSGFHGSTGAALLFLVAMNPGSPMAEVYMWRQILAALMAVYEAHKAARAVMVMEGRTRMAEPPDNMEDLPEAVLTITTTAAATALERWKRTARDGSTPDISAQEREGMDDEQIAEVDEPYANEWTERMLNSDEPLTQDQYDRVEILTRAAGIPAALDAVDNLTKAQAGDLLRRLEDTLGQDLCEKALLAEGKSFRRHWRGEDGEEYQMVWPRSGQSPQYGGPKPEKDYYNGQNPPGWKASQQPAAVAVMERDPGVWKTGGEPITERQKAALAKRGWKPEDLQSLTKAEASQAISGGGYTSAEKQRNTPRKFVPPDQATIRSADWQMRNKHR